MEGAQGNMKALLEHLYFLAQYLSESDLETVAAVFLIDLGFPAGKMSCQYLKTAILRYKANPDQLVTCELYLDVGKHYGKKSKELVEIAIRRELRWQWKHRDPDKWNLYFPGGIKVRKYGPSNLEFIRRMVELLIIWEGCRENYRKKAGYLNEQITK